MRLTIRHQTTYSYDRPIGGTAQIVRLFPRSHAGLQVLRWRVSVGGRVLSPVGDGLGNLYGLAVSRRATTQTIILVEGEVETSDRGGVFEGGEEPLPPLFYVRRTRLTESDAALAALGRACLSTGDPARTLMAEVHARVAFQPGATTTEISAAEAFARAAGVCQDHAHIVLAAARAVDIPARYVSGYLHTGKAAEPASHAWVEMLQDGQWLGIDPANGVLADEKYVRVAAGLDYEDVAPVRGVRLGGATERLDVRVDVQAAAEQ